jgi:hypothetical protein
MFDPFFIGQTDLFSTKTRLRIIDFQDSVVVDPVSKGINLVLPIQHYFIGAVWGEVFQLVDGCRGLSHFKEFFKVESVFFKDIEEGLAFLDIAGDFTVFGLRFRIWGFHMPDRAEVDSQCEKCDDQ